jgi:mannosyl-oligosaccharide alpha-1,2-mannosidase
MMLRMRRYRLFLAVAVLIILAVYYVTTEDAWDGSKLESLVGLTTSHTGKVGSQVRPIAAEPNSLAAESQNTATTSSTDPVPVVPLPAAPKETVTGDELLNKQPSLDEEFGEHGEGRYQVNPRPVEAGKAYWKPQKEHFPVSSENLIQLPSGDPKALPRIQYKFGSESSSIKKDRLRKQTAVREAFKHAWFGYKNHSLPHDELMPISGGVGDPFNGWGATLVDSLDTLWIMDLKDEFEDAVLAVSQIDFKTSPRKDIPLFETTIRYLGGLIGAYDLSDGKHQILLDKAVELADILMGAFDTPNRMPAVFYNWAPSYASQPHRASPHSVLAELGSLSVEFTRLAQITKEHKYYDAIARITDALETWQMKTTMPGLWPLRVDASGCKKTEIVAAPVKDGRFNQVPETVVADASLEEDTEVLPETGSVGSTLSKRQQLSSKPPQLDPPLIKPSQSQPKPPLIKDEFAEEDFDDVECEAQGLSTEPHYKTVVYGIGSMADSTYEYFPKEYALLGGLNSQYRTMYMDAMEVVRQELLFRPMTKKGDDILMMAKHKLSPKHRNPKKRHEIIYEGTHLGCYAGGMFALGSKLFDMPSDMEIARKITDGCVWAYGSTPVGLMPEEFEMVPCDSMKSCSWNEKKWHKALDPDVGERTAAVEKYNLDQEKLYQDSLNPSDETTESPAVVPEPRIYKRDAIDEEAPSKTLITDDNDVDTDPKPYVPRVAMSTEKYAAARILEERLPPGYTKIPSRDYRLRPEAIESVWIMYRLTGDKKWQDKGWMMFEAVDRATRTDLAHAGVKDVTSQLGEQQDTMESFWLAETLKYYYLLFSEPDLVSLDEWVLNTEAHPFRRPKASKV